jgi:putative flippase GtrA
MVANISGYIISSFSGYFLNKIWVFQAKHTQMKKSLLRYYLVYATAFLINIVCMYIFVDRVGISENIAPYFVLCVTIPYNFLLSKLWVYR